MHNAIRWPARMVIVTLAMTISVYMSQIPMQSLSAAPEGREGVTQTEPVPYYVVVRKSNGEPEFLFELAERFLGDGERFAEIFDLNVGRAQPGGGALEDPAIIEVGWVLQLPSDANGDGIVVGSLPPVTNATTAVPNDTSPNASSPSPTAEGSTATNRAPISGHPDSTIGVEIPVFVGIVALALGFVAAGVILIRKRRRASVGGTPFDDSLLRTDMSASWVVDRALRVLIAASEHGGTPMPRVLGVFIEGATIRLKLSSPASPSPQPWVVSEDGQNWSAPIARLQSEPVSDGSTKEFARLVTLGVADSGRVLIDFARSKGAISLEGAPRFTHEVLRRWLGELTGNPWSDEPRVVMIGNGLPQPDSAEQMSSLDQLVPELETQSRGILVLSHEPSPSQQSMLAARFSSAHFGWVVIVLARMPSAKWRFTVDGDSTLRSGFLPDIRFMDRPSSRDSDA